MQPTEDQQPNEVELIAHIRESLMAHEEPYAPGAWEKFNDIAPSNKRPIVWLYRLGGVAAVLALCFALFLVFDQKNDQAKDQLVKSQPSKKDLQPTTADPVPVPLGDQHELVLDQPQTRQAKASEGTNHSTAPMATAVDRMGTSFITPTADQPATVGQVVPNSNQIAHQPVNTAGEKTNERPVVSEPITQTTPNIIDFLANETKKNANAPQKEQVAHGASKWELGLMVAPSFGNTNKLNMGYGLSMAYQLSDKVSITSGLAYNEMNASKNLSGQMAVSTLVNDQKNLESVTEKVIGLDIPLEFRYHLNKNVYANVGVSAFAVLDQKRNNTYVENVLVHKGNFNGVQDSPVSGAIGPAAPLFTETVMVNKRVSEPTPTTGKNDIDYVGFYNFSIGYKKKINKNNSVSIEPFMKLPIKEVTQDNLRLIGTGLRLKFDF